MRGAAPRTVSPGLAAAPLTVAVVGDDGVGPGALLGLDVQHPVDRFLGLGQRLLGEAGQLRGVEPAHPRRRPLPLGSGSPGPQARPRPRPPGPQGPLPGSSEAGDPGLGSAPARPHARTLHVANSPRAAASRPSDTSREAERGGARPSASVPVMAEGAPHPLPPRYQSWRKEHHVYFRLGTCHGGEGPLPLQRLSPGRLSVVPRSVAACRAVAASSTVPSIFQTYTGGSYALSPP